MANFIDIIYSRKKIFVKAFNLLKLEYLNKEQQKKVHLGGMECDYGIDIKPNIYGFVEVSRVEFMTSHYSFFGLKLGKRKGNYQVQSMIVYFCLYFERLGIIKIINAVAHEFTHVWICFHHYTRSRKMNDKQSHEDKLFKSKFKEYENYLLNLIVNNANEGNKIEIY